MPFSLLDLSIECRSMDNTVYILDSYGLIFRCYFAFINKPLTNSSGQNVSAVFGFFRNLHSILKKHNPSYIFAAMDSKTPTFRHEMYKDYKATRNKTPEELHQQVPIIEEILNVLGIPVLQCSGYEADDIIASVVKKCLLLGRTCRILSADKDLMQLVNENIQILKPDRADVWKITGVEDVQSEWGVLPEQMLDLLSLYGDSSDNVPGVKGIGIKTAGKLLAEYKSLDGIYNNIDKIKGAVQKKLIEGKESAYFSQKLIRLESDVPCPEIDSFLESPSIKLNYSGAALLFEKYGIPSAAKQYSKDAEAENLFTEENTVRNEEISSVVQNKGNYKTIFSVEELSSIVDVILSGEKLAAFDCETDSLDTMNCRMIGFSLSYSSGSGIYVPLYTNNILEVQKFISLEAAFEQLWRIFGDSEAKVIFHNGKFDYKVLYSSKMFLCRKPTCQFLDTMIAAWLLSPDRSAKNAYSLEYLAETKLGLKGIEYKTLVSKEQTFADVPLKSASYYASEDADFTLRLWNVLAPELEKQQLYELFTNIEMPLMSVLAEMEINGIHINPNALYEYNKELSLGIEKAENEIYKTVGHSFNIASPKQLQEVLFNERGLKTGKKTKTGYSTDTSVLENLALYDPVPKMILEYRELAKLKSTYVENLPLLCGIDGRIHPDFIQTGTATGRLSCREPNLQNIPVKNEAGRKIRCAFTAAAGKILISADYSQIELAVLAHLSEDENMCKAFILGTDIHKSSASLIFGVPFESVTNEMRRTAKTINFAVIYGMSAFRLANELGISRTQAAQFIENYFKTYSAINTFIEQTVYKAEIKGYVETLFGRRRYISNINSKNKIEKAAAQRAALNTPVQGSAADIVKKAMLDVDKILRRNADEVKLLLQVHDELIFECPDNEDTIKKVVSLIKEGMENAVKLKIPLRVSIEYGKSWGEFH